MATAKNTKIKSDNKNVEPSILQKLFEGITLSETLLLAAVPIAAYLVVFFYEYGYFSFFHIPLGFVSFDLTTIFLVMVTLISVAAIMFFWGDQLQGIINFQSEPIKRRLTDNVLPTLFVLTYLFITVAEWRVWLFGLLFLLFFVGLPFLTPLFTQKNKKGYLEKLRAQDRANDKRKKNETSSVIDRLVNLVGPRLALITFFFIGILAFADFFGASNAKGQKEFLVVNTSPERAVLWTFGDHMASSTFDRKTKQVDPSFIILDLGKDSTLEYHLEQIGPLTVKALTIPPIVTITPTATQPVSDTP